jgi:uncharacterized DUF497 family protein
VRTFQWDLDKAEANVAKHRIDFEDAARLFREPHFTYDSSRSDEARFVSVGYLGTSAIAVVWTPREGDIVRIISARSARREERKAYREHLGR